jgi:methylated-DNA-[protein]-cysteine S-methyltransferase
MSETKTTEIGFALFDTAIGSCGIAWGERGIVSVRLPDSNAAKMRTRLARRFPGAREQTPPPRIQVALDAITALLRGDPADLSDIPLDWERVPPFERRVYEIARTIPPGATLRYGDIAARLGEPDARAVGQAMGRNPFPPIVPCHRVVAADGKFGGFSAPGGVATKLRMLAIEGALAGDEPELFDNLPPVRVPRRRT